MRGAHPPREERERHFRRTLLLGLAVSLVIHVFLVLLISNQLAIPPRRAVLAGPRTPPPVIERTPEGMRALNLKVLPSESEGAPKTRPPLPPERPRAGPSPGSERPGPAREEPAPGEQLTNAQKLRPRVGDVRVWEPIAPGELPARHLTGVARADSAVRAILQAYLDSVQLSEEAEKRAHQWLVGKGDKKWGIASDGLHLGGIVIPIPFGQLFQATGEKGRELEKQLQDLEVIQYQNSLQRAREVREERVKVMRKRSHEQEKEREEEKKEEAPPDTGSSGGAGGGSARAAASPQRGGPDVARLDERPLDSSAGTGAGAAAPWTRSRTALIERAERSLPRGNDQS